MQKIFLLNILLLIAATTFAADFLKVMYVADHRVPCDSAECLLVRDMPSDTFSVYRNKIEGFSYESGYNYCLLVNIKINTDTTYTLSEIKTKTKAIHLINKDTIAINKIALPFDTCKWILYKLKLKDGIKTYSIPKAYLQFDLTAQTLIGNTDCNDFFATYFFINDSISFKLTEIANAICNKRSIEPDFLALLQNTTRYKLTNKLLYLYDGKKLLGLFTKKK